MRQCSFLQVGSGCYSGSHRACGRIAWPQSRFAFSWAGPKSPRPSFGWRLCVRRPCECSFSGLPCIVRQFRSAPCLSPASLRVTSSPLAEPYVSALHQPQPAGGWAAVTLSLSLRQTFRCAQGRALRSILPLPGDALRRLQALSLEKLQGPAGTSAFSGEDRVRPGPSLVSLRRGLSLRPPASSEIRPLSDSLMSLRSVSTVLGSVPFAPGGAAAALHGAGSPRLDLRRSPLLRPPWRGSGAYPGRSPSDAAASGRDRRPSGNVASLLVCLRDAVRPSDRPLRYAGNIPLHSVTSDKNDKMTTVSYTRIRIYVYVRALLYVYKFIYSIRDSCHTCHNRQIETQKPL